MSKDIDHLLECHRLATERRSRGLKSWVETIDVSAYFHNKKPFTENRDGIVATVKASKWFKRQVGNTDVEDAILGLAESEDADEFDQYWDELYYHFDLDRVWIKTF